MMCIDCAWKASESGIFLNTSGGIKNSPKQVKQFDWIGARKPTLEVDNCRPAVDVDTRRRAMEVEDENPSKC